MRVPEAFSKPRPGTPIVCMAVMGLFGYIETPPIDTISAADTALNQAMLMRASEYARQSCKAPWANEGDQSELWPTRTTTRPVAWPNRLRSMPNWPRPKPSRKTPVERCNKPGKP